MMLKAKGHGMIVSTHVSKQQISLHGFVLLDDVDLVTGANDIHAICTTMIAQFQALMTCWNGGN